MPMEAAKIAVAAPRQATTAHAVGEASKRTWARAIM